MEELNDALLFWRPCRTCGCFDRFFDILEPGQVNLVNKMLSPDLKRLIVNQYAEYGSYRAVARINGISDHTVKRVVLDLHKKDKRKPGPKPKISDRQERSMRRAVARLDLVVARHDPSACLAPG